MVSDIADDYLFRYSHGFIQFGFFAATIFFCLSGFLVTPRLAQTGDVLTFTVHRFLRIVPGLTASVLAAMFIIGPLVTVYPLGLHFTDPGLYRYLKNIIFLLVLWLPGVETANGQSVIVNAPLWTLYHEALCYACLAIMSLSGMLAKRSSVLVVFLLAFITNALLWYVPELRSITPGRLQIFISLSVYFAAGVSIYKFREIIPYSPRAAIAALLLAMIALPLGAGVLAVPICVPYVVVCLGLSQALGRSPYRRDFSYGTYIFHGPVMAAIGVMLPSLRNIFLVVPVIIFATLSVAFLSWNFVEAPALSGKSRASRVVRRTFDSISSRFVEPNPGEDRL